MRRPCLLGRGGPIVWPCPSHTAGSLWTSTIRSPDRDDVLLLIEVADTSLRYDRGSKLRAYARARIPEVWIVDLTTDRVEVYREPRDDGYTDRQVAGRHATLAPVNVRSVRVRVSEIFGPASS